ncbi:unnamed protein product [Bubo scandiacus]
MILQVNAMLLGPNDVKDNLGYLEDEGEPGPRRPPEPQGRQSNMGCPGKKGLKGSPGVPGKEKRVTLDIWIQDDRSGDQLHFSLHNSMPTVTDGRLVGSHHAALSMNSLSLQEQQLDTCFKCGKQYSQITACKPCCVGQPSDPKEERGPYDLHGRQGDGGAFGYGLPGEKGVKGNKGFPGDFG